MTLATLSLVTLNCVLEGQLAMSLGEQMLESSHGPTTFPTPRPTTFFDPLCNDGRIKEEQRQACREYESDRDCCEAFRHGSSCNEDGQFYPGNRRDIGVLIRSI